MTKKKKHPYRLGLIEGWLSIVFNVFLFGLKYWAGIVTGSIAIIADAWHTISDSFSSVIILIGFKLASKPPDKEHPFGHGRAELISSLVVGIILGLIGFNFLTESIVRIKEHQAVEFGNFAIVVMLISIIIKEGMAQYASWASKKIGSKSLKADAWHHRTDAFSSIIILIGIILGNKLWWVDGLLGIFVSFMLFYAAFSIIRETSSSLLGEKPDDRLIKKIKDIAEKIDTSELRLHHFHVHQYGQHTEMTFHIVLPAEMKLEEAKEITDFLFREIKKEMNILATIHIDTKSVH